MTIVGTGSGMEQEEAPVAVGRAPAAARMAGGQPHDRDARQPCRGRVRLSCWRARLPALRELNAPPADIGSR